MPAITYVSLDRAIYPDRLRLSILLDRVVCIANC